MILAISEICMGQMKGNRLHFFPSLGKAIFSLITADSVIRPERTAKLRIKKHLAKRLAKKMKVAKFKGKKLKIKKKIENEEK